MAREIFKMAKFAHLIAATSAAFTVLAQAQTAPTGPATANSNASINRYVPDNVLPTITVTAPRREPLIAQCEPGVVSTMPVQDNSALGRFGIKVCLDNVDAESYFAGERTRARAANQLYTAFMELTGKAEMAKPMQSGDLDSVKNMFVAQNVDGGYSFTWTVRRPLAEVSEADRTPSDIVEGATLISTVTGNFGKPRFEPFKPANTQPAAPALR